MLDCIKACMWDIDQINELQSLHTVYINNMQWSENFSAMQIMACSAVWIQQVKSTMNCKHTAINGILDDRYVWKDGEGWCYGEVRWRWLVKEHSWLLKQHLKSQNCTTCPLCSAEKLVFPVFNSSGRVLTVGSLFLPLLCVCIASQQKHVYSNTPLVTLTTTISSLDFSHTILHLDHAYQFHTTITS